MGIPILARQYLYIETGPWRYCFCFELLAIHQPNGKRREGINHTPWAQWEITPIIQTTALHGNYATGMRYMITSSNGNIFRVTGPLCGEFTGSGEFHTQRPLTRSFDVFFDLRQNKRLSKQPRGWWFEAPSWSLWRQCNEHRLDHSLVFPW